ncbi:MAG: hypothetical protein JNL28_09595 [Planctomycetes bacterium]|nr:hypothetical protein [Planctomycetota bacterium]
MKSILLLLTCLFGLVLPTTAEEQHASIALFARSEGDAVRLALVIEVEKGWHIYSGPTMEDVGPEGAFAQATAPELTGDGFTWGDWRFPKPEIEVQDFGTPLDVNIHHGRVIIYRAGKKTATAKLEDLAITVTGQTCTDGGSGICVPFEEKAQFGGSGEDKLFADFPKDLSATAGEGAATPKAATTTTKQSASQDEEPGGESSLFWFLVSAVGWGLFTLLMPCTYPMIPITISYFTKQADARKSSTLPLSLAYGAGIVLIFVLIGIVIGPLIIRFATHPVTNLIIGGFFLLFALTLFGVLTLNPPRFLMTAAGSASQKGGYLGVFLMGATLVVTSFTCTAPFVGTLLSTGAASGGLGRIALGMGVFGLTMAIPFVFLSMVPAKVKAMPKSGEWMHTLKVFLGFVEVAAALKFLSNADLVWGCGVLSRELFLFLWFGIFAIAALFLFAMFRMKDEYGQEDQASITPKRMVGATATALFAVYCLYGGLGHSLDPVMTALVPNYSTRIGGGGEGAVAKVTGHTIIKDDFEGALARAKSEDKLLLVNFTGFT